MSKHTAPNLTQTCLRVTRWTTVLAALVLLFPGCQDREITGPPSGAGTFMVPNGNITLATKVWLPGTQKYPAMIIVEGSASDPKESFEANAALLTANGVAVIAYDKRGHFESTGPELVPTLANSVLTFRFLASDLIAVARYLKSHQNIDSTRIGIFCSSQGAWIGALAQALDPTFKYAINLVGSATSVGIEDYYSQLSGNDVHGNNLSSLTAHEIDSLVALYNGPPGFDPLPYLKEINNPQLWILAEKDFGNPTRQSVAILNHLVTTLNKNIEIIVVPNANHDLYDIVANQQITPAPLVGPWLLKIIAPH